jgi:hypothetical protein
MDHIKDAFEVEFKFIPQQDEGTTMAELAELYKPDFGFARWPPRASVDVYLDTIDLRLYQANATLRLRRWATPYKYKSYITANFKYPPVPGTGIKRRELQTILSQGEAEQACQGCIVGESAKHAATLIGLDQSGHAGFRPQVVIETQRSCYILRPRGSAGTPALQRGKDSDLLWLTFDQCTMYAAPTEDGDMSRFLRKGVLDLDSAGKTARTFMAEMEILAETMHPELASEVYDRAFNQILQSGALMPTRSKYSAAIEALRDTGTRHA